MYKTNSKSTQPVLWSRDFILLLLVNLLVFQGVLMLIPTFPAYIKQIGGNDLQASLPFAVVSISALIIRSFSGIGADTFGRRPLLIIGLTILIIFNCSYFFMPTIGVVLILRFFQGIGWGMASTLFATIMSDIVPAQRRGEGTGYFALSIIIATSLATIVGIQIMKTYDFSVILVISTTLLILGMLIALRISIKPLKQQAKLTNILQPITYRDLFEKAAVLPAFLCFLLSITLSGIMSFIMLYGTEIRLENTWIYFVGHISMILISRPFAGKLFDQKGPTIVIIPGALFMFLGLLLLSYATSVTSLLMASLLYGLGYGAAYPSLQAWAINRSPADRKGVANGTFLSSLDLGYAVGAVLLGLIATHTNYALMYRVSTLFLVMFAGLYGYYLLKAKKASIASSKNIAC